MTYVACVAETCMANPMTTPEDSVSEALLPLLSNYTTTNALPLLMRLSVNRGGIKNHANIMSYAVQQLQSTNAAQSAVGSTCN